MGCINSKSLDDEVINQVFQVSEKTHTHTHRSRSPPLSSPSRKDPSTRKRPIEKIIVRRDKYKRRLVFSGHKTFVMSPFWKRVFFSQFSPITRGKPNIFPNGPKGHNDFFRHCMRYFCSQRIFLKTAVFRFLFQTIFSVNFIETYYPRHFIWVTINEKCTV